MVKTTVLRRSQVVADFEIVSQIPDVLVGRKLPEVVYVVIQRLKGEPRLCVFSGPEEFSFCSGAEDFFGTLDLSK